MKIGKTFFGITYLHEIILKIKSTSKVDNVNSSNLSFLPEVESPEGAK